jgi:molybdopterin converting factor subunit 1
LKRPVEISFVMCVLFFAQLKDATGCDSVELSAPAPVSADTLWEMLLKKFPVLAAHRSCTRLACNGEYASAETRFADGDEVALIPPVSGG